MSRKPNIPDIPESVLKLYAAVDPAAFAKLLGWTLDLKVYGPSRSFRIPRGTFETLAELHTWLEKIGFELDPWEKNPKYVNHNLEQFKYSHEFQVYVKS